MSSPVKVQVFDDGRIRLLVPGTPQELSSFEAQKLAEHLLSAAQDSKRILEEAASEKEEAEQRPPGF